MIPKQHLNSNTGTPRLTIGLPVRNGDQYLNEALDSLLSQTFRDFEIVISDNASTDRTYEIARDYMGRDGRISYHRHPENVGGGRNHDFVVRIAKGEFFKWASDDDLYSPNYLERCITLLDANPALVLAHCPTTFVGTEGEIIETPPYVLASSSESPVTRFKSLLFHPGGDDVYGVMTRSAIQETAPHNSYHYAERPLMCEVALRGPFGHVPESLYFRRDHPGRGERSIGVRARCVRDDPRRKNRWRHPIVRLYGEDILGFVRAVLRAPISIRERLACLFWIAIWLLSHAFHTRKSVQRSSPDPAIRARAIASGRSKVSDDLRSKLRRARSE